MLFNVTNSGLKGGLTHRNKQINRPAFSCCLRALTFFLGTRLYIPIFLFFLFTARKSTQSEVRWRPEVNTRK